MLATATALDVMAAQCRGRQRRSGASTATEVSLEGHRRDHLAGARRPDLAQAGSKTFKITTSAERPLLATFCDAANIKESACTNAEDIAADGAATSACCRTATVVNDSATARRCLS